MELSVLIIAGRHDSALSRLAFGGMPMLPFGGRWRFIDYPLNCAITAKAAVSVIDGTSNSHIAEYCAGGWRGRGVRYYAAPNIASTMIDALRERSADYVFIVPADAPAHFPYAPLRKQAAERKVNVIYHGKERYGIYLSHRLFSDSMKKIYRQEQHGGNIVDALVPILDREHGAHNHITPEPCFGARPSSIYEYYRAVIDSIPYFQNIYTYTSHEFASWIGTEPETHIEKTGSVTRTILADSVRIGGETENSVIAANVTIEKGARVYGSVILPGNIIARGAVIENAVIGENDVHAAKTEKSVHESAKIGAACKGTPSADDVSAVLAGVPVPRNARVAAGVIIDKFSAREQNKQGME